MDGSAQGMELERQEVFPMIEEEEDGGEDSNENEESLNKTISTVKKGKRKAPNYSKIQSSTVHDDSSSSSQNDEDDDASFLDIPINKTSDSVLGSDFLKSF